jgi:hypothetical protein
VLYGMTDETCCRASARDAAIASQMGLTDFPVPLLLKPEIPRAEMGEALRGVAVAT